MLKIHVSSMVFVTFLKLSDSRALLTQDLARCACAGSELYLVFIPHLMTKQFGRLVTLLLLIICKSFIFFSIHSIENITKTVFNVLSDQFLDD